MDEQLTLFEEPKITSEELFEAYYSCRRHKRNTMQAMEFEMNMESELMKLLEEINSGTYRIGPSSTFIVDKPVKREIFATSFRDRIVHHLIINFINPTIEKTLIYDCYACRAGKGSHFGIERLSHFMRSASENYSKEAWVMKLDIKGFFMSIDRKILWRKLCTYLNEHCGEEKLPLLLGLVKQVIFNDPTDKCQFKCSKSKWKGLDRSKSLFHSRKDCGLPIGNLTSQVFANFYLSFLDHYIKHDLGIRYYGRYVDDFFLIHESKDYLLECRGRIRTFLKNELHLSLHPDKQYLQPVNHGVKFLGVCILPGHSNISSRTAFHAIDCIRSINVQNNEKRLDHRRMKDMRASVNSYLGILSHYDTCRFRRKLLDSLDKRILGRIKVGKTCEKIAFR